LLEIPVDFMGKWLTDDILFVIIIVCAIVLGLIIIGVIICLIKCCRSSAQSKDPLADSVEPLTKEEKQKQKPKESKEKLPFSDLKNPPKKFIKPNPDDEMDYADADYKDIYAEGPLSYQNASKQMSEQKKSEGNRL